MSAPPPKQRVDMSTLLKGEKEEDILAAARSGPPPGFDPEDMDDDDGDLKEVPASPLEDLLAIGSAAPQSPSPAPTPTTPAETPGPPPSAPTEAGSPPEDANVPEKKRGPGRPRKNPDEPAVKRGPGRPRKNPEDAATIQANSGPTVPTSKPRRTPPPDPQGEAMPLAKLMRELELVDQKGKALTDEYNQKAGELRQQRNEILAKLQEHKASIKSLMDQLSGLDSE